MIYTHRFSFYRLNGSIDSYSGPWHDVIVHERPSGIHEYRCINEDGSCHTVFNAKKEGSSLCLLHNFGIDPAGIIGNNVIFAENGYTMTIEEMNITEEEKVILILKGYEASNHTHSYHVYRK